MKFSLQKYPYNKIMNCVMLLKPLNVIKMSSYPYNKKKI